VQVLCTTVCPKAGQPQALLIGTAPLTEQVHWLFATICPAAGQPQMPLIGTAPLTWQVHWPLLMT